MISVTPVHLEQLESPTKQASPISELVKVVVEAPPVAELAPMARKFILTVTKTESMPVGLDLDLADKITAQICRVKPGLVELYNESADPRRKVQKGDHILSVNGVGGNAQKLIERIQQDVSLELEIIHPEEFVASVHKGADGSLGLDLQFAPGGVSLMVAAVSDGALRRWNVENPNQQVQRLDRIVAVNGQEGTPQQLFELIKSGVSLELRVARCTY